MAQLAGLRCVSPRSARCNRQSCLWYSDVFFSTRKSALTTQSFLSFILPVIALQYSMGVLVQLKGTAIYRMALLPVLLWSAFRAANSIDLSGGNPMQAHNNATFIAQMFSFAMRATIWAIAREPYWRGSRLSERVENPNSAATALWNAFDLLINVRGIGWNWPSGLRIPAPTLKTNSRLHFVALSAARFAVYAFAYDATVEAIRAFSPQEFSSLTGGTIYDHSLPAGWQFLRCIAISFLTVWMAYFAMQWAYQMAAIVFVILFQQHPLQWPPLFDAPWLSTSLRDLWGRRWHQMMRHMLLSLGGQPFTYLLGRPGGVIGTFLLSGIFHDIELRSVGRGGNSLVVIGFFTMNGVGVVLEWAWKKVVGKPVGGVLGWMWTFTWLALWGTPVVDEWAKAGRFGTDNLPGGFRPAMLVWSWVQPFLQRWAPM
ncbi:membrane bound O-acyl transferase family-domain-containing protein [Phlebopus sp. FC_14]|nr:membrane bound O-acyl transferase family-domain-containing protein [Phlebopus sp. FC_14]